MANISVTAKVNGDNTRVEANSEYFVSGKKVGNAYATLTGKDLCDIKKWEEIVNNENDHINYPSNADVLAKMIDKLDCGADALGKVQVYGQATYYKGMEDDLDFYESYWDDHSKDEARRLCEEACNKLNKNISTQLRYNGTITDQATIKFVPYLDTWGDGYQYWDYTIETNLLFPDGTSYSIDSYFDGVATSFEAKALKPDAAIFRYAQDKLGIRPEETVFLDDSAANVEAARALGFGGLHVAPGREFTDILKEHGL